jgi:5-methylcytosine-specific restriction protein A
MPTKPRHLCVYPLCPNLVEAGRAYCDKHNQLKSSNKDKRSSTAMGYDARWQKARSAYLRENPLCVECLKEGVIKAATIVDHTEPHKGDMEKFWDQSKWQSLCKRHHDKKTAKENRNGVKTGQGI